MQPSDNTIILARYGKFRKHGSKSDELIRPGLLACPNRDMDDEKVGDLLRTAMRQLEESRSEEMRSRLQKKHRPP
jgi:hypothetical protein